MVSIEDEWQRDPDATGDLDLLFVTFDPGKISIEKLKETITGPDHKFEVEIR